MDDESSSAADTGFAAPDARLSAGRGGTYEVDTER